MKFNDFKNKFDNFLVFTQQDVKNYDEYFSRENLHEWQKKNYIKKIIKGHYIFSDTEINKSVLFTIANEIYKPSYISFESALYYYHLIPEVVMGITSANGRNTYSFKSSFGNFSYKKIKPSLMFGYKIVKYLNHLFKIAEIEKAVLDFFYLKPHLKEDEDFEELRFNSKEFLKQASLKKFKLYLKEYKNKSLSKRMNFFLRYIKYA